VKLFVKGFSISQDLRATATNSVRDCMRGNMWSFWVQLVSGKMKGHAWLDAWLQSGDELKAAGDLTQTPEVQQQLRMSMRVLNLLCADNSAV
jgi:hypothetical protein